MEMFSRDELLAAAARPQLPYEAVEITLNGRTASVWVQGMSGTERDAWEKSLIRGRGKRREVNTENVRAKLAAKCLVDKPGGARLFTDDQAALLGNLPVAALNPIFEKAQRLSGVSDDDIDELEKLSASEAGSDSPTS